jgi:hypothetical protein
MKCERNKVVLEKDDDGGDEYERYGAEMRRKIYKFHIYLHEAREQNGITVQLALS